MIVRAEIKITLLMPAPSIEEAAATLGRVDLGYIVGEITDGEWLGDSELVSTTRVLPWDVGTACIGLGGPDDFFGEEQ